MEGGKNGLSAVSDLKAYTHTSAVAYQEHDLVGVLFSQLADSRDFIKWHNMCIERCKKDSL